MIELYTWPTPNGHKVHIMLDLKTPSSAAKDTNIYFNLDYLKKTDEVKFILTSKKDYEWAKKQIKRRKPVNPVLFAADRRLSPKSLARWVLRDRLDVSIRLRLHRILKIK